MRREFLDPLFEALGWDVFSKAGDAEVYTDINQISFDFIKLHKISSRTPQEKDRVAGVPGRAPGIIKIVPSADRAIDRLVSPTRTSYELSHRGMTYGLSEDDVKVVEG